VEELGVQRVFIEDIMDS